MANTAGEDNCFQGQDQAHLTANLNLLEHCDLCAEAEVCILQQMKKLEAPGSLEMHSSKKCQNFMQVLQPACPQ